MGSQASIWPIILAVAVTVGVGFLIPVLLELRRSARRLTSVLALAERSFDPLLRDLDAAVQNLDRVTTEIGAVTDDVRVFSTSMRQVGSSVGVVSGLLSLAGLSLGARPAAWQAGIAAGLRYLRRNLFTRNLMTKGDPS